MFVPKKYSAKDQNQIDDFIAEHPFVSLITTSEDGFPIATHIPIVAKKVDGIWHLEGHIALANIQHLAILISDKALCTILGAHGYISSSVYSYENVPTWNYEAVHLYGNLERLSDNELDTHLTELVDFFEKNREKPLKYADFSSKMLGSYKKEIVGFRLKVSKTEAAFKLSQGHSEQDMNSIIKDLKKCPIHDELVKSMTK